MDDKLKKHLINYKIRNREKIFVANFTDETSINNFLDSIAYELNNGADLILFKTSAASKRSLEAAQKTKLLTGEFDATFIIYDRIDIAFLTEAEAIILDENSISQNDTQKILGDNILIISKKTELHDLLNFVKKDVKTSNKKP